MMSLPWIGLSLAAFGAQYSGGKMGLLFSSVFWAVQSLTAKNSSLPQNEAELAYINMINNVSEGPDKGAQTQPWLASPWFTLAQ